MSNPWFDTLGVFDLETTGVNVETARIVSAHVGIIDSAGTVLEQWQWLADPGIEIPEQASAVHGISTERARQFGRPAAVVVEEIIATLRALFARGLALTVYNASYDLSLLHHEALRYGLTPLEDPAPIVDPFVIDKAVDRYRKGKRTLSAASLVYGVDLENAHDASADAIAAGRLAQAIARLHGDKLPTDVAELHQAQIGWSAESAASFQDFVRRTKDPDFTTSGAWPLR
ncbi:3'-5' exonuclease [Diaminobutyricimonas sp. TR449]|uniref:3'-5' exonuclease n=1 Tax=Diaminobutyricimonas sp. TR449 TaxID=2708076 RepID=UPI0014228EB2|nr:3'-5' exonuclease [Diaminobutyricimonas sp. TR449]